MARKHKTVLFLAANPIGTAHLLIPEEAREIEAGLQRARKNLSFKQLGGVRPKDFWRALLDYDPQYVHFSGHGSSEGKIILNNAADASEPTDPAALAAIFAECSETECVVLNCCYSKPQAEALAAEIPYVVGIENQIDDESARTFATAFYDALGAGRSIESAYTLGCGVLNLTSGRQESMSPDPMPKVHLYKQGELFVPRRSARLTQVNEPLRKPDLEVVKPPPEDPRGLLIPRQRNQWHEPPWILSEESGGISSREDELHGDSESEDSVWILMAQSVSWSRTQLETLGIQLGSPREPLSRTTLVLRISDVIIAAVFASIRPDYAWWIDSDEAAGGGAIFVGRGVFLKSEALGIDAAITIGGRCKRREAVEDVVGALSGNLLRIEEAIHPTLFVAAFAAKLASARIEEARRTLESTLRRNCHILGRQQVESLVSYNLPTAEHVLRLALKGREAEYTLDYFRGRASFGAAPRVEVLAPSAALAGEPFRLNLSVSRSSISFDTVQLRWQHPAKEKSAVLLLGPIEAESRRGTTLDFREEAKQDPFVIELSLEFLTYSVGKQALGEITLGFDTLSSGAVVTWELPEIHVSENLRPPFYDVPYREALDELERGFAKARAGRVSCVVISGAGGAGKTRLCEEMCLETRRRGAYVASARQAHSIEFPRRILADLLLDLTREISSEKSSVDRIDDVLRRLEPDLAKRVRPAMDALLGQAGRPASSDHDQLVISVLTVLIAERSQSCPVIIHLHDLHWCTLDVLDVIDRLIWQLGHLQNQQRRGPLVSGIGVLFLLEGRLHEHRQDDETGWSTRMFESFIERVNCPVARCRAFDSEESAEFTRRLFEQAHSAQRLLPRSLLTLQADLVERIHHVAGGNPLHILEQVKLLQQHGILAQNPNTGYIYMAKPDFQNVRLPSNVYDTIAARWQYYWVHREELAALLWAAALVDDNLPAALFHHLWRRLAPVVSQHELEATEFLTLPQDREEQLQISFRHENYFHTVRGLRVPEKARRKILSVYSEWFDSAEFLSPGLRYAQAKIELEAQSPDLSRIENILSQAQEGASKLQDRPLIGRILVTLLDGIKWPLDQRSPLPMTDLLGVCDDELELCSLLIRSGQTKEAQQRIRRVVDKVAERLRLPSADKTHIDKLLALRFRFLTMQAKMLYHGRQQAEAVSITSEAVGDLKAITCGLDAAEKVMWDSLIMKVRETHSTAIALSGDLTRAVEEARIAANLAISLIETDPDALDVIITSANILLCEAPQESESTLERYLEFSGRSSVRESTRLRLRINLSMAKIVLAYRCAEVGNRSRSRLKMAREALFSVFKKAHPLGRLKDAAASALLLGLIETLWGREEDVDWYSQSAALATRCRQLETLWRAQINLAHSLHRAGKSGHDPAAAALELMMYSLSSFPVPDESPRFDLLSMPMAHAVRYLLLEKDPKAHEVLRRLPALRRLFDDLETAQLKEDRDGRKSHEWLRVDSADYVIY